MKAKPTIVSAGDGRYRAEGMVFDRPAAGKSPSTCAPARKASA